MLSMLKFGDVTDSNSGEIGVELVILSLKTRIIAKQATKMAKKLTNRRRRKTVFQVPKMQN